MLRISGSTFIKPNVTRWCSKFYLIERIVNIAFNNVCDCQKKLGQVAFKRNRVCFFEIVHSDYKTNSHRNEYFLKWKVIHWSHYSNHYRIKKITSYSDKTINALLQALSQGIEKRFGPVLENEEYLLATAIIP